MAARTATVLPTPTSPVMTPSNDFGDTKANARDGFLMTRSVEQVFGGDVLGERSLGEAEVRGPGCAHHG